MTQRQVVLDTETTGLDPSEGHRIIEIGCVELIDREPTGRHYHQYIHPERDIDAQAQAVHGIRLEMLADKPVFAAIAPAFLDFIKGAELIIHNAPFDVGHIDAEFKRLDRSNNATQVADICTVLDSLTLARQKHPGQKNNLDALCKRYGIDNSQRTLHGALLDAEILAEVYLAMTGGQLEMQFFETPQHPNANGALKKPEYIIRGQNQFKVLQPTAAELEAHQVTLDHLEKSSGKRLWPLD